MFLKALGVKCSTMFDCVPVQTPATASQQRRGDSSNLHSALVAAVQPGICVDMIVYSRENDPHVEGLTKYLPGCHAVPGTSAAAENGVFVDCHRVSCLTAVFEYCNRGQNTALPSATNTGGEYRAACVMGVAGRCKKRQQLLPSLFPFIPQVSGGGL